MIKHRYYDFVFYNTSLIAGIIAPKLIINGNKIIIFEKNREFGIPRRCGNYLDRKYLKKLNINENSYMFQAESHEMIFFNEDNIEIDKKNIDFLTIDPRLFEKYLISKSSQFGVDIKAFTRISDIKENENRINSITVKSFKSKKEINIKYLISDQKIGQELYINNKSINNEKILSTQFEIYTPELTNIDYFSVYKFYKNTNGIILIFPASTSNFNVWMINSPANLSLGAFLKNFLKINNFTVLSIINQDFLVNPIEIYNNYSNHYIINPEKGLINPIKDHYLMTKIEMGLYITKFLQNHTNIEEKEVIQTFNKLLDKFPTINI
ncbi:MAG: hypothetical protein ACTSWR_04625 [Candidatus Helarchaeota archaeon]